MPTDAFTKPFFAATDSSKFAIGCFLYQKSENNYVDPIAAVSRVLNKSEQNYGVYRKEIISVLYLLKSMDIFLRFSKVNIEKDCRSILFLKASKGSNDVLTRYAIQLSRCDISIKHIPGKDNTISDALSRSRNQIECDADYPYMNQREAEILMNALKLPESFTISNDEVKQILQGTGLPSLIKSQITYTKKRERNPYPLMRSNLQRNRKEKSNLSIPSERLTIIMRIQNKTHLTIKRTIITKR